MKRPLLTLLALAIAGVSSAVASTAEHRTTAPSGTALSHPGGAATVPCDLQIRYDDGSDDTPASAPTLGWYTSTDYQYLGVRFTPPAGQSYRIQSASWFAEFWVIPGLVDVTAMQADDPTNTTTTTIYVDNGGTWEVAFPIQICVPPDKDYVIMLCPHFGVWGVVSDDWSAPDDRSLVSSTTGCLPGYLWGPQLDLMIWSCVTSCGITPVQAATWGSLKSIYR